MNQNSVMQTGIIPPSVPTEAEEAKSYFNQSRFADADSAMLEFKRTVSCDPQTNKRGAILQSYYQYPHSITKQEMVDCISRNPPRANHGMLRFMIDRASYPYLEMLYERETSARIRYSNCDKFDGGSGEGGKPKFSDMEISQMASQAWDRFIMPAWRRYTADKELQIKDLLLYARAASVWVEEGDIFPEVAAVEDIVPNRGAGHDPSDWEWFFLRRQVPAVQAYKNCTESSNEDWNKEALMKALRRCQLKKLDTPSKWTQAENDGSLCDSLEPSDFHFIYLFIKEWDGSITRKILPDTYGGVLSTGGEKGKKGRSKKIGAGIYPKTAAGSFTDYLDVQENFAENMEDIVVNYVDDPGHGQYYHTPSYAEKIFVGTKEYDIHINQAKSAAELSNKLIFKSQSDQTRSMRVLRDGLVLRPGTELEQLRYALPIEASLNMGRVLLGDMKQAIGMNDIRSTGPRKGRKETEMDAAIADQPGLARLRRFNESLSKEFEIIFHRFGMIADEDGPEKTDKALKGINCFLKEAGLEIGFKEIAENSKIDSVLLSQAGSPEERYSKAIEASNLLRSSPRSHGEAQVRRQALGALLGHQNAGELLAKEEEESRLPEKEDRLIGWENEHLAEPETVPGNIPVIDSDNDFKHLAGELNENQKQEGQAPVVIGHLDFAQSLALQGLELLQIRESLPESDLPVWADKVQRKIAGTQNLLEHSLAHIKKIGNASNPDGQKNETFQAIEARFQQVDRMVNELTNNFGQIQEARRRDYEKGRVNQGGGQGSEADKAQQATIASQLKVQTEAALNEIRINSERQMAELKMDLAVQQANTKAHLEKIKVAAKIAGESAKNQA